MDDALKPITDPKVILQNNAGALVSRKCRATGTTVTLYDGEAAEVDTSDGRYATVCENHGCIISHTRRSVAESHLSHPDEWCEGCMGGES